MLVTVTHTCGLSLDFKGCAGRVFVSGGSSQLNCNYWGMTRRIPGHGFLIDSPFRLQWASHGDSERTPQGRPDSDVEWSMPGPRGTKASLEWGSWIITAALEQCISQDPLRPVSHHRCFRVLGQTQWKREKLTNGVLWVIFP